MLTDHLPVCACCQCSAGALHWRTVCYYFKQMRGTVILLALLLWASAPAAGDFVVDRDRQQDFQSFRTFTLHGADVAIDRPEIDNPLIIERTTAAVRAALIARGLQEVAADADLRVDWSIRGQSFFVNEWGHAIPLFDGENRTPWQPRRSRDGGPDSFTEGTLVIDMTQISTGLLVWRGVHRERQREVARIADRLPARARKMLAQYPARKK